MAPMGEKVCEAEEVVPEPGREGREDEGPFGQQEVTEERAAESRIQPTSRGGPEVAKSAINAKNEVNKWLNRALNKGIPGLREEFMELKRYCPPDMNIRRSPTTGTPAVTATRMFRAKRSFAWF
ncbi:hypothetical protein L596_013304 [Steinernema carpocapsae]|uniref:Uncharacterized protein n=1 Tax=Steinernema carpocapsae TaxID=34508 RepID=A0A4U5P0F1_STECR|nr:hypothetical protein L596_013304 [Steinernema carpocapsae]